MAKKDPYDPWAESARTTFVIRTIVYLLLLGAAIVMTIRHPETTPTKQWGLPAILTYSVLFLVFLGFLVAGLRRK